MVRRKHHCFPYLAFIQFAIAVKREYGCGFFIQFFGKRCADCNTHSLAERSTGNTNTRQMFVRSRMTLEA
jgi:hypothetical protein